MKFSTTTMYKTTSTMLSSVLLSLLVVTSSADYIFNGYRPIRTAPTTSGSSYATNNNDNSNINRFGVFSVQENNPPPPVRPMTNLNGDSGRFVFGGVETRPTTTPATTSYNNNYNNIQRCFQRSSRDIRPLAGSCTQYVMCLNSVLVTLSCPGTSVFNEQYKSCVPKGSKLDVCDSNKDMPEVNKPDAQPLPSRLGTMCPRGATYKKAHPTHCARYYDCGQPAMMEHWDDHEWECKYPFLFNEQTRRCEHYSMVSCGAREEEYDRCDYKAYSCNGHAHCRPCRVTYPSCKNRPDGMNVWEGRVPSPDYVVCASHRVVYSGHCPDGQLFDGKTGTCVINQNKSLWG